MYTSFNNSAFQNQTNFKKALQIGSDRVRQKVEARELSQRSASSTPSGAAQNSDVHSTQKSAGKLGKGLGKGRDADGVRGRLRNAISNGRGLGRPAQQRELKGSLGDIYESTTTITSNLQALNTDTVSSSQLSDFNEAIGAVLNDVQSHSLYENDDNLVAAESQLLEAQNQLTNLQSSGLIDDLSSDLQQLSVDQGQLAQHDIDAAAQLDAQDVLIAETDGKITDLSNLTTVLQTTDSNLDAMDADMDSFLAANAPQITSTETVNTSTTGDQQDSAITQLANGGYVVTYESDSIDGGGAGLAAQIYDADGNTVGGELLVASGSDDDVENPAIVAMADGGFTVAFDKDDDVYGQRFDASGNTVGSEFQINTAGGGTQENVELTQLSDGGFLAIYESNGDKAIAQRYDADGNAAGSEFTIINNGQKAVDPQVTALDDGGFAVSYGGSTGAKADEKYIKVFDGNNDVVQNQSKFTNDSIKEEQTAITALDGGGFAVAYVEDNGANGQDIYVQEFDANGDEVGSAKQVNTTVSGDQGSVGITSLADGGYVVSYASDDPADDNLYAQRFDSSGNATGDEIVIDNAGDDQADASIVGTDDGFAVSYTSGNADKDIKVARYTGLQNEPKIAAINSELASIDSALGSMDLNADDLYATAQDTVDRLNTTISELDSMTVLDEADRQSLRSTLVAERDTLNAFLGNGYDQSMNDLSSELSQRQTDRTNLETSLDAQRLVLADDVATSQAAADSTRTQINAYENNAIDALQSAIHEVLDVDSSANTATSSLIEKDIKLVRADDSSIRGTSGPTKEDFVKDVLNGDINVLKTDAKFHIGGQEGGSSKLTLEIDRGMFVNALKDSLSTNGDTLFSARKMPDELSTQESSLMSRVKESSQVSLKELGERVMEPESATQAALSKTDAHAITSRVREYMSNADADWSQIHDLSNRSNIQRYL